MLRGLKKPVKGRTHFIPDLVIFLKLKAYLRAQEKGDWNTASIVATSVSLNAYFQSISLNLTSLDFQHLVEKEASLDASFLRF